MSTMKTKLEKRVSKNYWVELSLKRELLLLPLVVAILGISIYQGMVIVYYLPAVLAYVVVALFCISFIFGIGRRMYSKIYIVILLFMGFVALSNLVIAASDYSMAALGWECRVVGDLSSCMDSMVLRARIATEVATPLAILSVVAVISQFRKVK